MAYTFSMIGNGGDGFNGGSTERGRREQMESELATGLAALVAAEADGFKRTLGLDGDIVRPENIFRQAAESQESNNPIVARFCKQKAKVVNTSILFHLAHCPDPPIAGIPEWYAIRTRPHGSIVRKLWHD